MASSSRPNPPSDANGTRFGGLGAYHRSHSDHDSTSSPSSSLKSQRGWYGEGDNSNRRENKDAIELEALNPRRIHGHEDDEDDYDDNNNNKNVDNGDDDDDDGEDDAASSSSFELSYSPEEERAVVRKFDRLLVLFVALLYMLAFLDRSNIGNARIAGMDSDLQTSPPRDDWYTLAIQAFYVTYIGFEWMSLLWRIVPAHIYISLLVLSWGIVASLQAVSPCYPVLIILRALLGIGEAGFAGIPLYLSFFFKRDELAFRTAIFISAAPLATSFASTLAWVILKLGEASPITPWRLLFLAEGFPSVIVAVIAWHVIPDSPDTASYLTSREKTIARFRLQNQNSSRPGNALRHGVNLREALAACVDPVALIPALMLFLTNMAYSSLPVFLPTILEESMGHDRLRAQALSAPPYIVSFFFVLAAAKASDAIRSRSGLLVPFALTSAFGYAILALSEHPLRLEPASPLRYLAVYPAAVGFFSVVVLTIVWTINNQPTGSRQGGGFALLQAVGQFGPIVGARLYPTAQSPFYTRGMAVCATAMLGVAALALLLRWIIVRRNRGLDAVAFRQACPVGGDGSQGEAAPAAAAFRFMI